MRQSVALRSGAWVVARIGAQGLEFAAWVLLARNLGARGVGELAVAAVIARTLGLVGDWGAAFRGPRDVVVAGRDSGLVIGLVRRRELTSAGLTVLMALGCVLAGYPALLPVAAAVASRGATRDWIALGESRRVAASSPLLVQGLIICVGVLFVDSVGTAAVVMAVGHAVGLAVSIRLNPVAPSRSAAKVVVDGWYLLASIADQVLVSSDTLLLALLRTTTEAGVYSSVYRLPLAWISVVGLCAAAAIPLATASVRTNGASIATTHQRADRVAIAGVLLLIVPAFLGMVAVGPLFGVDFQTGHTALFILFLAAGATTASAPYRVLYAALGSDRSVGLVTAVAAGANVLANLVVIGPFGMEGAAATTLLTQLAMCVYFVRWSRQGRVTRPAEKPALVD